MLNSKKLTTAALTGLLAVSSLAACTDNGEEGHGEGADGGEKESHSCKDGASCKDGKSCKSGGSCKDGASCEGK